MESVGLRGRRVERPRLAWLALATEERERARAMQAGQVAQVAETDDTVEDGLTGDELGCCAVDDTVGPPVAGMLSQISSYKLLSSAAETGSYCARTACTSSLAGTGGGVSGSGWSSSVSVSVSAGPAWYCGSAGQTTRSTGLGGSSGGGEGYASRIASSSLLSSFGAGFRLVGKNGRGWSQPADSHPERSHR